MTNEEIYELADRLGMVEEDKYTCVSDSSDSRTCAQIFADSTKDIVNVMKFVDELTLYNDLETIKKFLVALLVENSDNK